MTLSTQVQNHTISSEAQLKAEFRLRSLECHPDQNPGSSHEAFVALQADFEQARRLLAEKAPGPVPSRLSDVFFDLVALGLLDERFQNQSNPSFSTRLAAAASAFDSRPGGSPGDFTACLAEIRGLDASNELAGFRAVFHDLISYRYNRMQYMKRRMLAAIAEVRQLLQERKLSLPEALLKMVMDEVFALS